MIIILFNLMVVINVNILVLSIVLFVMKEGAKNAIYTIIMIIKHVIQYVVMVY